jgi:hypothetical protein
MAGTRVFSLALLFASTAFTVSLAGCPKPPPPVVVPPPPPGDTLRLMGKAGDKATGSVKVRLEKSEVGSTKKPKTFAFNLEEEHVVEKADESGNLHMTAKFFNIEAQGDSAKEKKAGEAMARALSEIQIAYDVSNRGDVTNFEVKNIPDNYLSEARLIASWVYGAEHGPLFDSGPIEQGKAWQVRAQIPIPSGGSKNWEIGCTYSKKERNVASIAVEGKVTGESQGTQLSGEVKGEIRLDVPRGVLTYQDIDSVSTFRSGGDKEGGHQVHIHITWEAQAPAGGGDAEKKETPAPAADGKTAVMP